MTERGEPTQPIPNDIDIDSVRETLAQLTRLLQIIDATKETQDAETAIQWMGSCKYVETTLVNIIAELQDGAFELGFTAGSEPLKTVKYDLDKDEIVYRTESLAVEPGETLPLTESQRVYSRGYDIEVWRIFGNKERAVEVGGLAAAVSNGGTLSVIEREPPIDQEA